MVSSRTSLMPEGSKYPQAAEIMQPTKRPRTTEQDFIMGDPNRSQSTMVKKTTKPNPINSALPQGSACGAPTSGHTVYMPLVGRDIQLPEPPIQSSKPLWTKETPISITVGPVTMGGKILRSVLGGMNDKRISI